MCDEFTEADAAASLQASKVSRRHFGLLGAGAALVGCTTTPGGAPDRAVAGLAEGTVSFPMPDGTADAFFVHPAKGRHPGVILWPDIAGLRDAKQAMARRLAAAGYAVLVVNQYYRAMRAPVLASFAEWRTPEGQAKIGPMRAALTPAAVMRDAAAYVAWLDGQKAVDTRRGIGAQGYCMGGPFAVRSSIASQRVRAAASFHGGGIASEAPDSPHLGLGAAQARYLIAVARGDDQRNPQEKERFRAAAAAAGRPAEIEVYAAEHGWCVPDSPVYDAAEADRAFARLLALYAAL